MRFGSPLGPLFFLRRGLSWGVLVTSWGRLGPSWRRLGASWGLSWRVLGLLGASWRVLGRLGSSSNNLGGVSGAIPRKTEKNQLFRLRKSSLGTLKIKPPELDFSNFRELRFFLKKIQKSIRIQPKNCLSKGTGSAFSYFRVSCGVVLFSTVGVNHAKNPGLKTSFGAPQSLRSLRSLRSLARCARLSSVAFPAASCCFNGFREDP